MFFKALTVAAAISGAMAQRPNGTSICDYYTTALLKDNTAANQKTLLTLVVNTAVIGNYTKPNVGIHVPGILAPGEFNGTKVNLAGYFNGGFASTNSGGSSGKSVNFLDDGGAAPLLINMPANGTSSRQYALLTHLYSYFGTLLGCSTIGQADFPAYEGSNSMYSVHKYMGLSNAEISYFITQVALAGASFGVTQEDLAPVGMALASLFGMKCAPPTVVIPSQAAALQAICIDDTCPTASGAVCSQYEAVMEPAVANASLAGVTATGTASGTAAATASGTASGTAAATAAATSKASGTAAGTSAAGTAAATATAITKPNAAGMLQGSMWAVGGLVAALFL